MRTYIPGKSISLFLLLFLLSIGVTGQTAVIDSLRNLYTKEKDTEKRLKLFYFIGKENKELNLESAFKYADTLEKLSKTAGSLSGQALALELRGSSYKDSGKLDNAIELFYRTLELESKNKNQKGIAKAYNNLGATYADLYKHDSAVVNYLKSIDVSEKSGDWSSVASGYSNLGNVYVNQQSYAKGIGYLEQALKIRLEHGEEKKCIYTYNNLSVAYSNKGDIPKALEFAKKGVELAIKYDNKFLAGVLLGGICHLYLEAKKGNEAIPYCEKSIAYLEEAKRDKNLVFPLVNLAAAYNLLNQPEKSLIYSKKGYDIMLKSKLIDPLGVYYEEMGKSYEKLGNVKEAIIWYKKLMILNDSLFKVANVKNLAEIDTKYQTQKKETEIATQKLKITQQEGSLFRQRTWIIGLFSSIILIGLLAFLYYNRLRLKQKAILDAAIIKEQKLGLNAVIEAQDAERKRIAKDLHDGIAQELVALHLGMSALKHKLAKTSPNDANDLNELSQQLNDSCTEVRNISHTMMPPTLELHGLAPSLELLLRNTFQHTTLHFEFDCIDVPANLDEKVKIGIYRIAQELLNNIVKHAQAAEVWVKLFSAENSLVLRIEDNGKGFDYEDARMKGSMGLLNILSRVNTLNGVFSFEPAAKRGAVSVVKIPI